MKINAEELKGRIDCVEYVAQFVYLKKSGNSWKGRCPFHEERHASFCVWPDGWKCFGACQDAGDIIDFVKKRNGVGFKQACEILNGNLSLPARKIIHIKKEERAIDPTNDWQRWRDDTPNSLVSEHAQSLGVHPATLHMLGIARWQWKNSWVWAFPQRNAKREIIGIRFRTNNGKKWALENGHAGLFIPECKIEPLVYITEGPTDCAALLSLGLCAIGRPSCEGQEEMLNEFLLLNSVASVVIVADNDTHHVIERTGEIVYPGIKGALTLQSKLSMRSAIWIPPLKDSREFVNNGGSRELMEELISNLIWNEPR